MTKFVAGEVLEPMEWDFTDFVPGATGVVPEPTTGRLNGYRSMIKRLAHDVRELRGQSGFEDLDPESMDEDEALETLDSMDEQMAISEGFQQRTIEAVAYLCGADWTEPDDGSEPELVGGSPDLDTLQKLPYRVLQAFSRWVMGELTPKSETGETPKRPTPTDFKRSRKVGKRSSSSRSATLAKA